MIDTATIVLIDSNSKKYYDIIKERDTDKGTWPCYIDKHQKEQGIIYKAIHKQIQGRPTSYVVLATLSFRKLLDDANSITLATEQDYPRIEERLEDLLKQEKMPPLSHWQASRIDFSYNLHTPYVSLYLKLLKRGILPRYYRDLYNPETEKYKQREGSLYLVAESRDKIDEQTGERRTGPKCINIYSKYDELLSKGVTDQELLEQAKDVLRLEVQTFAPRLRAIKKRDCLPDMSLQSFFRNEIAVGEIALMVKKIMGVDADYYAKPQALKLIKAKKKMHQTTKTKLEKVVKHLSEDKRKDAWTLGSYAAKNKKEWKSCIHAFKDVNVNPIVINKRDSVGIPDKMLKSPLRLFLDASLDDILEREEKMQEDIETMPEEEIFCVPHEIGEEIDSLFYEEYLNLLQESED